MENETQDQVLELDAAAIKAIAKETSESLSSIVKDEVAKALETKEAAVEKSLPKVEAKQTSGYDSLSKELKTLEWVKSLLGMQTKYIGQQSSPDSDGGYLIPPAEFVAEVRRLEETYGVARANARIRFTDRTSVQIQKKASGVTLYDTDELEVKTLTKMTFERVTIPLRKWAGISIIPDELEEDVAVSLFNELTTDFARANARKQDEIMFTDATSGIINDVNAPVQVVGTTFASLDFDSLNEAMYKVATPVISTGMFFFHPTMLGVIQRIKDNEDNYILQPGANGMAGGTLWGRPYVLTDVLPSVTESANNTDFMVYGDPKQFEMVIRKNLTMEVLREGTVGSGENAVNLASQDAKALRAVSRMDGRVIFPTGFCIFRTGTAS